MIQYIRTFGLATCALSILASVACSDAVGVDGMHSGAAALHDGYPEVFELGPIVEVETQFLSEFLTNWATYKNPSLEHVLQKVGGESVSEDPQLINMGKLSLCNLAQHMKPALGVAACGSVGAYYSNGTGISDLDCYQSVVVQFANVDPEEPMDTISSTLSMRFQCIVEADAAEMCGGDDIEDEETDIETSTTHEQDVDDGGRGRPESDSRPGAW